MSLAQLDAKTATAWFISSVDAARTRALELAPRVQLVCQSSAVHLSVSGHATLVRDAAKLEELWSEPLRAWFPDGKESADLTLVRVELGEGEFWDQSGSRGLTFIFDAAKAWLTGDAVESDPTAHARANLHQS
jgi:general stress protein 26